MLHKVLNSKGEVPYCFSRSSIKFQGHTGQNITILTQIGRFRTIGRSQLSNPSDLPCLSISPPLSWYLAFMCLIRPQSVQSMIKNTNDPHYWPLLLGESTGDRWIPPASTETEMLSFWRNCHHWLHWKLSIWQLPVQPVVKVSKNDNISVSVNNQWCVKCVHAMTSSWNIFFLFPSGLFPSPGQRFL